MVWYIAAEVLNSTRAKGLTLRIKEEELRRMRVIIRDDEETFRLNISNAPRVKIYFRNAQVKKLNQRLSLVFVGVLHCIDIKTVHDNEVIFQDTGRDKCDVL